MWSDLLKEIARQADRDQRLPAPSPKLLDECWPTLVGPGLARRSTPLSLEKGCLHIATNAESLAREWKRSPMALIRRLRRFSPWPIDSLSITYDPNAGQPLRRPQAPSAPSDAAPPSSIGDSDGVDDELQSLIRSIESHRQSQADDES